MNRLLKNVYKFIDAWSPILLAIHANKHSLYIGFSPLSPPLTVYSTPFLADRLSLSSLQASHEDIIRCVCNFISLRCCGSIGSGLQALAAQVGVAGIIWYTVSVTEGMASQLLYQPLLVW